MIVWLFVEISIEKLKPNMIFSKFKMKIGPVLKAKMIVQMEKQNKIIASKFFTS